MNIRALFVWSTALQCSRLWKTFAENSWRGSTPSSITEDGVNQTRLAREAGIDPATLSKFIKDKANKQQLQTNSVEKIARVAGLPPYETAPAPRVRGLSDVEAERYVAAAAQSPVDIAVQAHKTGKNGVDPWILNARALELEGYMPGDVLLVDLNESAIDGDVVCAQVYDRHGKAETVFRVYEHPFLVSASTDASTRRPLLVDNNSVILRGVVVASIRPRRVKKLAA